MHSATKVILLLCALQVSGTLKEWKKADNSFNIRLNAQTILDKVTSLMKKGTIKVYFENGGKLVNHDCVKELTNLAFRKEDPSQGMIKIDVIDNISRLNLGSFPLPFSQYHLIEAGDLIVGDPDVSSIILGTSALADAEKYEETSEWWNSPAAGERRPKYKGSEKSQDDKKKSALGFGSLKKFFGGNKKSDLFTAV